MEKKIKIVLHFPQDLVDKPIVYKLVKDFDLQFNILKAEVNPDEEGLLVLELTGDENVYAQAIAYLAEEGVRVQPLSQDISMNKTRCIDCTLCVPLCPTDALVKDEDSGEVTFIKEKCIACGICVNACPYKAMSITF